MHDFTQETAFDVEALRARLRQMDDKALESFGKAAAFLCRPEQCRHGKPRDVFVIQLQEARAEWRRRHGRPNNRMQAQKADLVAI
jgi:hypothetical protein